MKLQPILQSCEDPSYCRESHYEYHCDQSKNFQYIAVDKAEWSGMSGFKKCLESHLHNQLSQDALSLIWGETQVVAVIADGVSQAFYGNLAAYEVSTWLSWYLWENRKRQPSALEVTRFLDSLQEEVDTLVQNKQIPEDLPAIVREVLEKRREYGSETVFAACVLDLIKASADIYVLGNVRVDWRCNDNVPITLVFSDKERWSSKHGCKGIKEVRSWNLDSVISLSLQSDGLSAVFPTGIWNVSELKSICQSEQSSHDDDISVAYFECKPNLLGRRNHTDQTISGSSSHVPSF